MYSESCEMLIERNRELYIDHIIALCHTINDYEGFRQGLMAEICNGNPKTLRKLSDILNDKRVLFPGKTKAFYNRNKNVIDTINKYTSIHQFVFYNYNKTRGVELKEFELVRKYIERNKNQIDKIIALLKKLKELGFKVLRFDENYDFSKQEYQIKSNFSECKKVTFLSNITVIPSSETNYINYKTSNSPYKIDVTAANSNFDSLLPEKIELNSLTFDITELPNAISKEAICDKLINLAKTMEPVCTAIRNSTKLYGGILELEVAFQALSKTVDGIQHGDTTFAKSREDISKILSQIGVSITSLKENSTEYDKGIILSHPEISKELLQQERAHLHRARKPDNDRSHYFIQ